MTNSNDLRKHAAIKPSRRRRKQARPAEILGAALAVFARNGFHAASMEEIGALAGVSKGTVYLYYGSKEHLFMAAIRSVADPLLERSEFAVVEWHGTMSSLLRQLVLGWHELVRTHPVGEVLKLMLTEARTFPSLARQGEMLFGRVHAVVRNVIERGMRMGEFRLFDPDATAQIILAPLGFREICRSSADSFGVTSDSDETYFSAYVDLILQGIETR